MKLRHSVWLTMLVACLAFATGCSSGSDSEVGQTGNSRTDDGDADPGDAGGAATGDVPTTSSDEEAETPEVLLEPFDPPTLAELDATAEWEDQPVLDSMELLRQRQQGETVSATVEEALALRNDSDEANAKILSAMGRLPEDDQDVNWDATMNRHLLGDIKSTNPIMISATAEFDISGLISYGLFSFDWTMTPFAAKETVVSWQTSKDRMYDKVVMRDDCTWSDGTPITAHDVVFTFKTILNPKVPVPAVRSGTDKLRWVEAYDDYTLVYFHKEPLATNVGNIGFPVIPKHIYEESIKEDVTLQDSAYHIQYENAPVVGGAYEIVSRARGEQILLRRRESWYMHEGKQVRDKPYFKEVRFRIVEDPNTARLALNSGQIDDLELSAEQWVSQTDGDDFYDQNVKVTAEDWTYFHFLWNQRSPYFGDVRVRKAMSYAFDYQEMLDKLCYGLYEPCFGTYHPNSWMQPEMPKEPIRQDLDKAEELLDEAGWEDHDGDGIRDKDIDGRNVKFEFSIMVRQDPLRVRICELLKFNLEQIGVTCNIAPMEATVLQERILNKEFQASYGGWGSGADPDTSDNVWATGQGRNFGSYSNPEVDRLFEEGRKEFDREKRAKIYARINDLIYEDQPSTFLFYRNSFYGFNRQLRGYNFSPRGPYHYGPGFSSLYQAAD